MSYRCVSGFIEAIQIAAGLIRTTFLHRVRPVVIPTTCIIFLVSLSGCNHVEFRSDRAPAKNRKDAAGQYMVAGTPIPGPNLLDPQPAPNCEFRSTDSTIDDRQKLDYERQCYRHAEIIARNRLRQLQASVDRSIRAIRQQERARTWPHWYRQQIWSRHWNWRA
jgi:hypothetical protein